MSLDDNEHSYSSLNGPVSPLTLGSMFSSGTTTSSMKIIPVVEERKENFPSILGAVSPFISFSRMKPFTPSSFVLAQTWGQKTRLSYVDLALEVPMAGRLTTAQHDGGTS